jgi:hypothetical protein
MLESSIKVGNLSLCQTLFCSQMIKGDSMQREREKIITDENSKFFTTLNIEIFEKHFPIQTTF